MNLLTGLILLSSGVLSLVSCNNGKNQQRLKADVLPVLTQQVEAHIGHDKDVIAFTTEAADRDTAINRRQAYLKRIQLAQADLNLHAAALKTINQGRFIIKPDEKAGVYRIFVPDNKNVYTVPLNSTAGPSGS